MLGTALVFGSIAWLGWQGAIPGIPKPPEGAVYDLSGPPNEVDFQMTYVIHLAGEAEPVRREMTGSGWWPEGVDGEVRRWKLQGYEARAFGRTQVEVLGKKRKDGTIQRVKRIEFESPDLPADQLPKVVWPRAKKA